jgi:hypothetical protein
MTDIRPDRLTTCQSEREVGRKSTTKCKCVVFLNKGSLFVSLKFSHVFFWGLPFASLTGLSLNPNDLAPPKLTRITEVLLYLPFSTVGSNTCLQLKF